MYNVIAYQIAENINIKDFRKEYAGNASYYDSFELFYANDKNKFIYVLHYGVVVFSGYDEVEISNFFAYIIPFCKNPLENKMMEEFPVYVNPEKEYIGYNEIVIKKFEPNLLRIIMLNVAQSVAIDYFTQQSEELLEDTRKYTHRLEHYGRLNISGIKLRKYIGKTLNLKNRIAENLYILDSPIETWEDEYINKVDTGLKKTFDINLRYRNIIAELEIIKENLDLFKDLLHFRRSNMLEWIIIILILVEVANMLFEKIF